MHAPPDGDDPAPAVRPDLLLFLCVANVCRSPAMQFLVARSLEEHGAGGSWQFASAGTAATERQQMCASSAAHIAGLPGGAEFARTHRSRRLEADLVERAGLILVTSQRERAVVARLVPSARARTFTLIEAALLADKAASRAHVLWAGEAGDDFGVGLDSLVAAMQLSRGLLLPQDTSSVPTRGLFSRPRGPGDFDIGDVHSGVRKRHAAVLADLQWASEHLARACAAIDHHARR